MYVDALEGFSVTLFGYWAYPDGETEDTARRAHETDARAVLYEIAANLSKGGAKTEVELHFGPGGTHKRELAARLLAGTDADGVLLAGELTSLHNILVPLRDDRHAEKIVEFVTAFDPDSIFVLELYHAAADSAAVGPAESMLESVAERLLSRGLSESDLELTVEVLEDPQAGIAARSQSHDLVVLGQTEMEDAPSPLFGTVGHSITDLTDTPILVVR